MRGNGYMKSINNYHDQIKGSLHGFDRIIFKGHLRQFFSQSGRSHFLSMENVLLKDYSAYAQSITSQIKEHAREMAESLGRPYIYLNSPKTSKEGTAKEILKTNPVNEGLICVIATVELCTALESYKNHETHKIELRNRSRKCLYLYFYYMDKEFGFMHVKLQTWFPFEIQIYINGREHLAKMMDQEGIGYQRYDNCFLQIDNLERAQELFNGFFERKLSRAFDALAHRIHPFLKRIETIFSAGYYWCVEQCEYATDIMFESRNALERIYNDLVEHALVSFSCDDVMTFLGRKMHHAFSGEIVSDKNRRPQGLRIKHRMKGNSLKMYDKYSVLRIETTINNPHEFKILKKVTCHGEEVMKWVPMGKSVVNLYRYAQVSQSANTRYWDALHAAKLTGECLEEIEKLSTPVTKKKRKYTGFNLLSQEVTMVFAAVLDGKNLIKGFSNADIRGVIYPGHVQDNHRRVGKTTRLLAKMRAHGLIAKIPHTFRYKPTVNGIRIMSAILRVKKKEIPGLIDVA